MRRRVGDREKAHEITTREGLEIRNAISKATTVSKQQDFERKYNAVIGVRRRGPKLTPIQDSIQSKQESNE